MNTNSKKPLYSYSDNPLYIDRALSNPNWSKVLFNDRPIQASELIEIQSIQQRSLHRSLSALYKNGSIIKGLYPLTRDKGSELEIEISPGLFYIDGFCIEVQTKSFSVSKEGDHAIYISINESVITENEDPNLRDTNTGGRLYGMEGASRLLWHADLLLNEETEFPLVYIKEGVVSTAAERRVDASAPISDRYGDFIIEGYSVYAHVEPDIELKVIDQSNEENSLKDLELGYRRSNSVLNSLKKEMDYLSSLNLNSHEDIKRKKDLDLIIKDHTLKVDLLKQDIIELRSKLYQPKISESNINTFSKGIEINPGSAYVDNKKVEKESLTYISYKHNLPEIKVEGKPFIHFGNKPFNKRTMFYGTYLKNMADCLAIRFVLYINFYNLRWNDSSIDIRTSFIFDEDVEITSISDLSEYLANRFMAKDEILDRESYSSLTPDLHPYLLRSVIQENLNFYALDGNSLYFESLGQEGIRVESKSSNSVIVFDRKDTVINHLGSNEMAYFLDHDVSQVHSLIASVKAIDIPITRSSSNGMKDSLPDDSVLSILSVKQEGIDYVEGRDYFLSNNNEISWASSDREGIKPEYGSTYYITFLYTKPINDYSIDDQGYLRFTSEQPENGTYFYITYSYYQEVVMPLSLRSNGEISVSNDGLLLAHLRLSSRSVEVIKTSINRRWTSEDIDNLRREIVANRESLLLLSDQVRFGEDRDAMIPSEIDIYSSDFTINPVSGFFSPPLLRRDIKLPAISIRSNYLTDTYIESKEVSNYIPIPFLASPFLSIDPIITISNDDSIQALPFLDEDLKDSWFVRSATDKYLSDNEREIRHSIELGHSNTSEAIMSDVFITLLGIGLEPNSKNYNIYIDKVFIPQSNYVLNSESIVDVSGSLSSNDRGEIRISLRVRASVGMHLVEIKRNSELKASSYFSVLDVKGITDYISSFNKCKDIPFYSKNKALPKYPGNKGSDHIPTLVQEFETEEDIFVTQVDIDIKGKALVVIGSSTNDGVSILPSLVSYLREDKEKGKYKTDPVFLSKGKYYLGIIPLEEGVEIPINKVGERSIDSSLIIEPYNFTPLQITDGYSGTYIENLSLVFSLKRAVFNKERSISLGSFESRVPIKAFSLNVRPIKPSSTEIKFLYERQGTYIPIEPFELVTLPLDTKKVELIAITSSESNKVSTYLDTLGSSVSVLTSSARPVKIQSREIYITQEFNSLELRIEHIGNIDNCLIWNSLTWSSGLLRRTESKGGIRTSYYVFESTPNLSNLIKYRVESFHEIRNVEVLIHYV